MCILIIHNLAIIFTFSVIFVFTHKNILDPNNKKTKEKCNFLLFQRYVNNDAKNETIKFRHSYELSEVYNEDLVLHWPTDV